MTRRSIIVLLSILGIFLACHDDNVEVPDALLERIHTITVYSSSVSEGHIYSFIYDDESKLIEIHWDGSELVKFHYTGDMLSSYDAYNGSYHFTYNDGEISSIVRELYIPPDIQATANEIRFEYQHGVDNTFTRFDLFVDNQVDPPVVSRSTTRIFANKQETEGFSYSENDTLHVFQINVDIQFDQNTPNPLRSWNFPEAYNFVPLQPFFLANYPVVVPEVFFSSEYLPTKVTRTRVDEPGLSAVVEFEYIYADNLLVEIRSRVIEEGAGMNSENVSIIVWE